MSKRRSSHTVSVMAAPGSSPGVVPAIHVFKAASRKKGVDARNECGHDERVKLALRLFPLLAVLGFAAAPAEAQSVADFYRGKTITMAVGTSPGGDYDLRMRMVARYIGRHIPGNPTIIATNMPGAGQMLVANWLASVAPKDGTVIVALSQNLPASQATGATGVKYDVAPVQLDRQHDRLSERHQLLAHDGHSHDPGRDAARVGRGRDRDRERLLSLSTRA